MPKLLYVHIPFCRKKCAYCDFCSVPCDSLLAGRYIDVLCRQLKELEGGFSTIYVGGGTPTVLSDKLLRMLFNRLSIFARGCREFSVEVNPESVTERKLGIFIDNGVNRISIGAQSFQDDKLRVLGRCHDAEAAVSAVKTARGLGINNISIDLIYGVPGESWEGWRQDIVRACSLPVTHISTYALTCERGTPMYRALKRGALPALCDGIAAMMYERARDYLTGMGFCQYEVSNFARRGFLCRHNFGYWRGDEYVGIGASAVSYSGGKRSVNEKDIESFIAGAAAGKNVVSRVEKLGVLARAREAAAVKIRTMEGIDFVWFNRAFGVDFLFLEKEALKRIFQKKLVAYIRRNGKITGIRLTRRGALFCDDVSSALV